MEYVNRKHLKLIHVQVQRDGCQVPGMPDSAHWKKGERLSHSLSQSLFHSQYAMQLQSRRTLWLVLKLSILLPREC